MKKTILILLIFSSQLFAGESETKLNFSYDFQEFNDQSNRYTQAFQHQYKYSGNKGLEFSTDTGLKNTERGNVIKSGLNMHHRLNRKTDIWAGAIYREDELLKIAPRLDWKIGSGLYLIKDNKFWRSRALKFSYGLIFRENRYLHSFRLRDECRWFIFDYEATVYYIIATHPLDEDELRILFNPRLKLYKITPGIKIEYVNRGEFGYLQTMFNIGIKL